MDDNENHYPPVKIFKTIPPGIFYPDFMRRPGSKRQIRLINHSITQKSDNILHFISADCEFYTPVSKLPIDLRKIDKNNINKSKPKRGHVIVTTATKTKVLSTVLTKRYFEDPTMQDLREVLRNVADTIQRLKPCVWPNKII